MVTLFVSLIKDSEGEVKILSIGQAPGNTFENNTQYAYNIANLTYM